MFLFYNLSRYPLSITVSHSFLLQAQSGLSRLVGEEDARTARAMFCLGSILIFQNKFPEAEEQLSRVTVPYKKIDGNRSEKIMCQEEARRGAADAGEGRDGGGDVARMSQQDAGDPFCRASALSETLRGVGEMYASAPLPGSYFRRPAIRARMQSGARSVRQSFSGRMA